MTAHRNELVSLSKCLRSADEQASRNAAYRIKDLVLASNPAQRDNQVGVSCCPPDIMLRDMRLTFALGQRISLRT